LAAAGISANQVTLSALVLSVLCGAMLIIYPEQKWPLLLIPLVLFLRMALNAIDGMLAREHAMQSSLGAMLNELGDVVSDAALYLPFCWVTGISPILVVLIVLFAIIGEMAGVVSVQIGASRRYDGPMGKSDRAFVFGFIALILGVGVEPLPWVNGLLSIVLLMSMLTIFNRARLALKELS
jgi:CDP-diacylglycerol--glycerol-3-phosphate 3-phosphatidyltransferase